MAPEIKITSPIDDSQVGVVPAMDRAAVDQAVETARAAQVEWSQRSIKERQQVLQIISDTLRGKAAELASFLTKEVGKTPDDALTEAIRSADLVDNTITELQRITPLEIKAKDFPGDTSKRVQTVTRQPLGVVLAIGPFNYPINLTVSKIAPALAVGNTVVFKPATQGSVTGRLLLDFLQEAGVPDGLIVPVTGRSAEIGDHLIEQADIAMIAMTGSTAVGQRIAKRSGMVPLLLELGGNDAAIVCDDADLELAAKHIAAGAFKYSGQRCTAVKRVYVAESVASDLVARLVAERNRAFGSAGDPRDHPLGPVITDQQAAYLDELLADATANGGRVVCGGHRSGRAVEATIIDAVPQTVRLVAEEQFGPLLPVVHVADDAEAVAWANQSEYGLQASVFSRDLKRAQRLADQLEVGGVHLNGPDQRGPDNFMFVGHKQSGIGAQGVRFALAAMSRYKGVVSNP